MEERKFLQLTLKLVDKIDPFNSGHSERVARLSDMIALNMEIEDEEREILRIGALLHDIGKVLLPEDLWMIPREVSETDRSIIQKHPILGAGLLEECNFDRGIIDIVKYHHERWDGTGYPERLKGKQIPLLAQVTSLSETYISMISYNIYSRDCDEDEALENIASARGQQFAPEIVDLFLNIM